MSDPCSFYGTTKGADGADILHVLAKRTYVVRPTGHCRPAPNQLPISMEMTDHEREGQGGARPPKTESEAMCNRKPGTDVVVQGRAHATRPRPAMDVAIAVVTPATRGLDVWRNACRIRVFGDRQVQVGHDGTISFSAPQPFETMELSYDRAYGGRDIWAEAKHPDEMAAFLRQFSGPKEQTSSRYAYPRNPAGRGYLVERNPEALAALKLPNLENPDDLLTPDRLCVGSIRGWHKAPVPAGCDWTDPSWFPRLGFLGLAPDFDGQAEDLVEVKRGVLPAAILSPSDDGLVPPALLSKVSDRFHHGASPSLCLPTLSAGASILVSGMHPTQQVLEVHVPPDKPRVFIEPPLGTKAELRPFLRTVVLDTEAETLFTVWAASLPMDRPLTNTQRSRVRYGVQWS